MASTGEDFGLAGRVCVITGAGGGIGRGTALAFGLQRAKVAILDVDLPRARETLELIEKEGAQGMAVGCDIGQPASVQAAHAAVLEKLGPTYALVNNAAVRHSAPFEDFKLEDWERVLRINLTGYFLCSQVFGRSMIEKGEGAIVHVGSLTADHANPLNAAYCVAKGGVSSLSRQIAIEWGPKGVRSNVIHPGMIQASASSPIWLKPGIAEQRSRLAPSRRPGFPDDIANAALFLASPRSSYVNGHAMFVDGGLSRSIMTQVPV